MRRKKLDFVRQFLLVVTLLPALLMLFLAAIIGVDLGSTGLTLWTFAGVLYLTWSDREESRISWRRVLSYSGGAAGGFAAILIAVNLLVPSVFKVSSPSSIHFPGKDLAREVRSVWKNEGYEQPIAIIGGERLLAQNASWYHGTFHRPLAFTDLDPEHASAISNEDFSTRGGVVLWTEENASRYTTEQLQAQFGEEFTSRIQYAAEPLVLDWNNSAAKDPLRIFYAVVHPESTTDSLAATVPTSKTVIAAHLNGLSAILDGQIDESQFVERP